ncbi:hypothetical protein [Polymorphospora lycopeni]|uniref:Uncharacterized protein n=1 Tax=Polymorphospora lycopeni TaxID=3140240 RepID=A0ABV5CP73_9ACTN
MTDDTSDSSARPVTVDLRRYVNLPIADAAGVTPDRTFVWPAAGPVNCW